MTNVPRIRVKSETVNTAEEVTIKREEVGDGSIGESFLDIVGYSKNTSIEFEILPVIMTLSHLSSIFSTTYQYSMRSWFERKCFV
jgi:hypothetical protein